MANLLILEDNEDCISIYEDILTQHQLTTVRSLAELNSWLENRTIFPDLLLADMNLPDGYFLDWVSASRPEIMSSMSTIIVSSLEDMEVLGSCFEWGAVDYLIKPFKKNDLTVKINKALGHFNVKKRSFKEEEISEILEELTSIEAKIFQQLVKNPDKYVAREKIMKEVWRKVSVNSKTLDVHLSNIRKKLIQTSWSIDYQDPSGWKLIKSA